MSNKLIEEMMENVVAGEELKRKILEQTSDKVKVMKFKKRNVKKIILVASMCIMLFGTMTAFATNYSVKIGNYLARFFGFSDETMKELVDEGYVDNIEPTNALDEDGIKGEVSVSIMQTIADGNTIRILMKVKSNNGFELNDNMTFDEHDVEGIEHSSCRFSKINIEDCPSDELWFSMELDKAGGENGINEGDEIFIKLNNLIKIEDFEKNKYKLDENNNVVIDKQKYHVQFMDINNFDVLEEVSQIQMFSFLYDEDGNVYYITSEDGKNIPKGDVELVIDENDDRYVVVKDRKETVVLEDSWELGWKIKVNEDCVEIPVDDIIDANGYRYYIESVKIRGFAMDVIFAKEAEIIDESYVLENSEIHMYDKMMMEYARIMEERNISVPYSYIPDYQLLDIKLLLKDGSEYILSENQGAEFGVDGEWYKFIEKIDLENVDKVIIEGREYKLQ